MGRGRRRGRWRGDGSRAPSSTLSLVVVSPAARAEARALFEIIPESQHDNDLLKDVVALPASERLPVEGPVRAWVARKEAPDVLLPYEDVRQR